MDFIKDIENLFEKNSTGTMEERRALLNQFRNAKITMTFKSKWSLPIYFQLRRREINTLMDSELIKLSFETSEFANVLMDIFNQIWSKQVILSPLTSKFLSLHCQIFDKLLIDSLVRRREQDTNRYFEKVVSPRKMHNSSLKTKALRLNTAGVGSLGLKTVVAGVES